MANTKVTTNVIADDAITGAKIADDAINSEHYTDGSIDTAHIADDQVTLAKMAGLARGKIIYGDSSGNPAALAPGSNGQVLKSDGTDIAWGTDSSGVALDDISTGDAATTLATSAGNITIDAQGSDTDIIFKGTDGSTDTTFLTLDGSEAGWGSFNTGITLKNGMYINNADGSATSGYLYNDSDDFIVRSYTQDKDIIFKGNDGSSVITALTLDMSDAGAATFNSTLAAAETTITTTGTSTALQVISTDAGASASPILDLYRNSSSAADGDILGLIKFTGNSGGSGAHTYGQIRMENNGVTDGQEQGKMIFDISMPDGDLSPAFHIGRTEIAVNEDSEDLNFRVESNNNAHMLFVDGGNDRVGIGTASPSTLLHLDGTTNHTYLTVEANSGVGNAIKFVGANTWILGNDTASGVGDNNFALLDGSDARITVDASGNVGINNSSPLSHLTFESDHWNTGTEGDGPSIRWNNGITTADSVLQNFEDGNVAPFVLGMNSFVSSGGSFTTFNNSYAASYLYLGSSGAITFGTSSSGTATERMQIKNSGEVLIGTQTAISNAKLTVDGGDIMVQGANNSVGLSDLLSGYTRGDYGVIYSTANHVYFVVGTSYVSYINGGNGTFNVSDQRLKENVATLTGALDKVKQLRGVSFTWKDTEERGTDTAIGLIAQEVETVYPELVDDGSLPKDNDGNDPLKSVNYAHLTSVLIEAIKELSTELDAAKARITTLEG